MEWGVSTAGVYACPKCYKALGGYGWLYGKNVQAIGYCSDRTRMRDVSKKGLVWIFWR